MRLSKAVFALCFTTSCAVSHVAVADVKVDPNLQVNMPKSSAPSSTRSSSSGVSYTYAGLLYMNQHVKDSSCTQDGIQAYGSLYIREGWFAQASFGDVSGSRCGSSRVAAGGGYRTPFNDQFDMYGTLQLETISPDDADSDSGLVLTGGMRGFLTQELEGVLELVHSTTDDGQTGINLGGRYWFQSNLAATVDFGLSGDYTMVQIGGRMNF